MKRKFFILLLGATGSVLLGTFAFTFALFQRSSDEVRHNLEGRMIQAGALTESTLARLTEENLDDEKINEILEEIKDGVRFERLVVVDSFGFVYWSSSPLFSRGADYSNHIIHEKYFRASWQSPKPHFTPLTNLDNLLFQSLFYPLTIEDEKLLLILDADHNILSASRRTVQGLLLISAVFTIAVTLLFTILFLINSKAQKAEREAQENRNLAVLGRVSAELAHELKNPLAIMKSSTDVLQKKFDSEKKVRAFLFLSEEIMRVSRLITDILSFSREKTISPTHIRLYECIKHTIDSRASILTDIETAILIDPDISVYADQDSLIQIIDNLLRNSIRALGSTGSISIAFTEQKAKGLLTFSDSGPGIDPAIAKTLFTPFVSGSKTGTGLGLSIVQTLCQKNGFTISLRSAHPATFNIEIERSLWQKSS